MEEKKLNIIEADQLKEVKDYNAWLDDFVCIQGIDVTASAYQGVVNGIWYDITVGQVLDKSRNVDSWKKVFQRRLCNIENNPELYMFLRTFTEKALEIGYRF